MGQFEEASPICRGKNLSWETILLFYNNMPRVPMPKAQFNSYTESKINAWTQTHSQLARQLAFYYEDNGICYPRFTKETDLSDLFKYMQNWAIKYFIPNPFAPSLRGKTPTCIYAGIIDSMSKGITDFNQILDSLLDVKLSSHDKVNVYLSNFTDLIISNNEVSINGRTTHFNVELHPDPSIATDYKKYYEYFGTSSDQEVKSSKSIFEQFPLQQIFYGAPGTGKSHEIKRLTSGEEVIRTTFHPDSDYSTFVGSYKPTTQEETVMTVIGTKAVPVENADGTPRKENKIVYEFVNQAFLQAYINAWKMFADDEQNPKKQYLIIEEINRGNCAQIFGDLFQLLDRSDTGFSEYPIKTDTDMEKQLSKAFKSMSYLECPSIAGISGEDVARKIRNGEIMLLPPNLYIWATMNTSDQSLFPIDSAFKRRWDWKYLPIEDAGKNWKILVNGNEYEWYRFLQAINKEVLELTHSEDKQLGYFFVKAQNGVIDANTLVNKVYFYLWNDVFKDYDIESQKAFKKADSNDAIAFKDFFDGLNIIESVAEQVLVNLGLKDSAESQNENSN